MSKPIRRFSQGSPYVASYIRDLIPKDIKYKDNITGNLPYLQTLPKYSLTIPISATTAIEADPFIIDKRATTSLEQLKVINWCTGVKRLLCLSTPNDGNSLCHAASIALWGIDDESLQLRQLVNLAINSEQHEFKKRWMKETERTLAEDQDSKSTFEAEWEAQVKIASETNRSIKKTNPLYNPLEDIHIFILSNILRRPILVFADKPVPGSEVKQFSSETSFSCIYLPLLWPSTECYKSPILLGYSENYFTPLVTFASTLTPESSEFIPLTREDGSAIEARYLCTDEAERQEQLLHDYLQVVDIEATKSGKCTYVISAAKLIFKPLEESTKMLEEFLTTTNTKIPSEENSTSAALVHPIKAAPRRASLFRCGNKSCLFFITNDSTFPYCSECYERKGKTSDKTDSNRESATPPVRMDMECAVAGCPYFASVNSFPYCQRCHLRQSSKQERKSVKTVHDHIPVNSLQQELSLEEKWLKLAMGIIDEEVVVGKRSDSTNLLELVECFQKLPEQEIIFTNKHRIKPLEENEKIAIGGVTSTRSLPQEETYQRRPSVTGGRSIPIHKCLIEEEEEMNCLGNEWQRRVSWVNEPCQTFGCPYFASLHTFPYCNQCSLENLQSDCHPPDKLSGITQIPPAILKTD